MNMERPIGAGGHGFDDDPRPIVPLPSSGMSAGLIAGGCVAAAILLFLTLNHQRLAREQPADADPAQVAITAPPPLAIPATAPPMALLPLQPALPAPATAARPPGPATFQHEALRPRMIHPIVMEPWPPPEPAAGIPQDRPGASAWPDAQAVPVPPPTPSLDGLAIVQDSGESRQWSGSPALRASPEASVAGAPAQPGKTSATAAPRPIGDVGQVIAMGTLIEAVLETAVDSSRPGMTRAIVSKPVRSFDGSRILIPRGARLVGEIKGQAQGGNRLLIQWGQLILPNGTALDIDSPGADAAGEAGLDAKSHGGFGQFVSGLLQSAVTVGAAVIGARGVPVYYAYPVAGGAAQFVPRTGGGKRLTVAAGAQINVVVARTLDFTGARS